MNNSLQEESRRLEEKQGPRPSVGSGPVGAGGCRPAAVGGGSRPTVSLSPGL